MQKKTVVITGATSGIGAAYAKRFSKQGHGSMLQYGRYINRKEGFLCR